MIADFEVQEPVNGDGAVLGVGGRSPQRLGDEQDDGGSSAVFVWDAGRSARLLSPTGNDGAMQILGPPAYCLARRRSHRRGGTRHGETHRLNNRPVRKSEL